MPTNRKHLSHIKSSVTNTEDLYGLTDYVTTAKRPSAADLVNGEIAVNYANGHELLTIKNNGGNVVGFLNENEVYDSEEIIVRALAQEKADRIAGDAANAATITSMAGDIDDIENALADVENRKMFEVTWSQLRTMRNGGTLKRGQLYRITDYVTTTVQDDTMSNGIQFDIIVLATDFNKLSEDARPAQHTGVNVMNIDKMQIKYCLDNDTDRFAWADDTNGKGVIYYMKDVWGNECPYDFKNIRFRRYSIHSISDTDTTANANLQGLVYNSSSAAWYDWLPMAFKSDKVTIGNYGATNNHTDINPNNDGVPIEYMWTFTYVRGPQNFYEGSNMGFWIDEEQNLNGFHDNVIKPCYEVVIMDENNVNNNTVKVRRRLNNNVFYGFRGGNADLATITACYGNELGVGSRDNTFVNTFENKIGEEFHSNIFLYLSGHNKIGKSVNKNIFGVMCIGNTFGDDVTENRFLMSVMRNVFGGWCSGNYIGNMSDSVFGINCEENYFLSYVEKSSFGDRFKNNFIRCSTDFMNNKFGVDCENNHFMGSYVEYNTFGDRVAHFTVGDDTNFYTSLAHSTFENDILHITIDDRLFYVRYFIVKSDNSYITLGNSRGYYDTDYTQKIIIDHNFNVDTPAPTTIDVARSNNAEMFTYKSRHNEDVVV